MIERSCGLTLLLLLVQLSLISCQNGNGTAGGEVVVLTPEQVLEPISPYNAIGRLSLLPDPLDISTHRNLLVKIVDFTQKKVVIIDSTPPPFPYVDYFSPKEIAYITSDQRSIHLVTKILGTANTEDTLLSCRYDINSRKVGWNSLAGTIRLWQVPTFKL